MNGANAFSLLNNIGALRFGLAHDSPNLKALLIQSSYSNLVPRASYLFDIGIAVIYLFYRYPDIKKVRCPGNEVVATESRKSIYAK